MKKPTTRFFALLTSWAVAATFSAAADPEITSLEPPFPTTGEIERLDPRFDDLVPAGATLETLASGFDWSEGPVWDPAASKLYFSDVPRNIVYQWDPTSGVSIYISPSGFTGEEHHNEGSPGANGLMFDLDGRLLLCQHGDRRLARLNDQRRGFATLASHFKGQPLNSPNDLTLDSAGNVYFTDPPYGRPKSQRDKGLPPSVYRLAPDGTLTLLSDTLFRPNGIALSPDEKTLYVANADRNAPRILSYPILDDGSLGQETLFFDSLPLKEAGRRGNNDGLRADVHGNVWATAPGGVIVISPQGEHLGSLLTGRPTANLVFGGPDRSTLYITADDLLLRIETNSKGYFPSGERLSRSLSEVEGRLAGCLGRPAQDTPVSKRSGETPHRARETRALPKNAIVLY